MIRISVTYCRVPLSICCTPKRDVTTSSLQLRKREHALHAGVVQLSGVLERGEGVNGFAIRNKTQFRSFFNERSLDDGVPPVGPRLRAEACSLRLQTCHQAAVHTVRQQMHPAAKQLDDRNNTDERSPKASNNGLRDLPLKNIPSPNCGKCRLSTETKNLEFPVHSRRTSHSTNLSSPDIRAAKQLDDPSLQCQPPESFTLVQERHTVRPVAKQRGGRTMLAKPELNVAPNPCNHLKQLHHAAKQLDDTVRQKLHPAAKQLDDRMPQSSCQTASQKQIMVQRFQINRQSALTVNQHVNRSTSAYPRQATKPLLTTNAGSKCPHLMKAALLDCCEATLPLFTEDVDRQTCDPNTPKCNAITRRV